MACVIPWPNIGLTQASLETNKESPGKRAKIACIADGPLTAHAGELSSRKSLPVWGRQQHEHKHSKTNLALSKVREGVVGAPAQYT
jgi:hypothetical protein